MRRFSLTLPLVTTLAFVACSHTERTSEVPNPSLRPGVAAAGRLPESAELAGTSIATEDAGPWRLRRAGGGDAAATEDAGGASDALGDSPALVGDAGAAGGARAAEPAAAPATARFARLDEAEKSIAPTDGAGPGAHALRAGSTDDNADLAGYLEFLRTWTERRRMSGLFQPLDVSGRRTVRVVDAAGRPVPGAVVSVVDEQADRVLWSGTTYGDGRIPWYPRLDAQPVGAAGAPLVEAYVPLPGAGALTARAVWVGEGDELTLRLTETVASTEPVALDVCFVIDTTGSMGDEIESLKASLLQVTGRLRGLAREFDLRYAAVLYRDLGDEYVTATHPFTADIAAFDTALRGVTANGGGDTPESLNQALAQAVDGVAWRSGAAKVVFVLADAPPHMDYAGDVPYGDSVRAAVAKGIRIHTVAASGLDALGTLVFRQVAQFTRGKFVFLEYGSPEAAAASHGVTGAVRRDNLEDILFEQIRDEVAGWGRPEGR